MEKLNISREQKFLDLEKYVSEFSAKMNSSINEHKDKLEASEKRVTELEERIRIFDSSLKERVESAVETVTNKPENAMDTGPHPPPILTNWAPVVSRAVVGGANQVKERMPREQTEVLNNKKGRNARVI